MSRFISGFGLLLICVSAALGQQVPPGLPTPRIQSVFPAGAKAGTTVEVTITGTDLDEPAGLYFSSPGLSGEFLPPKPPPVDPKKPAPPPAKKQNIQHNFKVTISNDTPTGLHDVRVVGKWGVSNPRVFVVGTLPEVNEKEPNNDIPEAQRVEIGTAINGVIASPTDVDYTVFAGKKGQRVVISCLAGSIDSRVKPMIEIFDQNGRKTRREPQLSRYRCGDRRDPASRRRLLRAAFRIHLHRRRARTSSIGSRSVPHRGSMRLFRRRSSRASRRR